MGQDFYICLRSGPNLCSSNVFLEAHQGYIISDQIYQSSSLSLRCHSNRAGEKWKYFSIVLASFYNFKNRALLFVWSIHTMGSQHFDPDNVFLFWLNLSKGTCQKLLSGFCPLRGGSTPQFRLGKFRKKQVFRSKNSLLCLLHAFLALFGPLYGLFGPFLTLFNEKKHHF